MNTNKTDAFINDIIIKYHPLYSHNGVLKEAIISNPSHFNIEYLYEESLAFNSDGVYEMAIGVSLPYDFTDGTDAKTSSVRRPTRRRSTSSKTFRGDIPNIQHKIGSLRIAIYNAIKKEIDFMYIPFSDIKSLSTNECGRSNTDVTKRIQISWNSHRDDYCDRERYRVSNFLELAKIKSTEKFIPHNESTRSSLDI